MGILPPAQPSFFLHLLPRDPEITSTARKERVRYIEKLAGEARKALRRERQKALQAVEEERESSGSQAGGCWWSGSRVFGVQSPEFPCLDVRKS